MSWKLWKFTICGDEAEEPDTGEIDKLNVKLAIAEEKLQEAKDKLPSLAKATASARRVRYRVDKFTETYKETFGRMNHG